LAQISSFDDCRQQKVPQTPKSPVERLLADARLRLVETGTRNRLVHTPRGSKRRRSLPIICVDADGLFESLARSGRTMRFLPTDATGTLALEAHTGNVTRFSKPASADVVLQTSLDIESLEKRLLAIYRDAKTAEEEQGINILFLAIGFLRWYEDDKSDVLRQAPLVLVPVSLTRDPRRSTFDLHSRDEDIATNQAIQERLRSNFGITLPDIPEDEEWRPFDYFATVREAIAAKPRWSIDPNGVELGFYSFSKLLMIRDLDPAAWADKSILEHPLLRGLLAEGFDEEPAAMFNDAALDQLFAPRSSTPIRHRPSSSRPFVPAATSWCRGRPAPASRRQSPTSSPARCTTGNPSCSLRRKWQPSMSCMPDFAALASDRFASNSTVVAPTSDLFSPNWTRRLTTTPPSLTRRPKRRA
jgi:hypothetical protein